jgi:hypothetical protein
MTQQQPSNHIPEAKKMVPGDELHLTLLMAPFSLNFFTGQDRQHLLAFGRAAFEAGQAAAQQAVQAVVPSDADIDAAIQAFDWDGWIDQGKAKRAFTREALARWAAPAHPAEGAPAQAEPFMWAIQEPGGSAYMDKNCVSTSRGIVEAEVDGLNLGLDADDEPYKVVPVYLAATQPAQAVPSDDDAFQAAIDMLHSARVELDLLREALNVPVEPHQSLFERVLDAAKATHPTQQGMDAFRALYDSVVHSIDEGLLTGKALEAIILVPAVDFFESAKQTYTKEPQSELELNSARWKHVTNEAGTGMVSLVRFASNGSPCALIGSEANSFVDAAIAAQAKQGGE